MSLDDKPVADYDEMGCTAADVYVLTGEHACYACGCYVPVHTVLAVGPFSAVGAGAFLRDDTRTALMRSLGEVPASLLADIEAESSGRMYLDHSKTVGNNYLMNHCRECGGKIGDHYVHRPDEAFFPTDEDGVDKIRGRLLPGPHRFESPNISHSSWTDEWLARQKPAA